MAEAKSRTKLDKVIEEYGGGEGALMPALQAIQQEEGFLSEETLCGVAEKLKVPLSRVYGVVTFYSQFRLHKCGRHTVKVCHGTACHVAGVEKIADTLEEELKIEIGETTSDGKFTLETVACLGCCSLAPVIMIDGKAHGRLAADTAKRVIKQYERHE